MDVMGVKSESWKEVKDQTAGRTMTYSFTFFIQASEAKQECPQSNTAVCNVMSQVWVGFNVFWIAVAM